MAEAGDFTGKKLFFLHPAVVVKNRVIPELIQQEYEVYQVGDAAQLRKLLKKYPNSLVFGNPYDGMTENEWEGWIHGVVNDPLLKAAGVGVGIICATEDENLRTKYKQLGLNCGYIVVKSDLTLAMKELFEVLRAAESKGRRKFVRATIEGDSNAKINVPVNGVYVNGTIKDLSAAGFSCALIEESLLEKNTVVNDIQMKLGATILKIEGIVFGARVDGDEKIYVMLFTRKVDPDTRAKIRTYINTSMQSKIDAELKS